MDTYSLGALPSPHDTRDYPVAKVIPMLAYPEEYLPPFYDIHNQGKVGACVAYALKSAVAYFFYKEYGIYAEFSANFIYGNRADTDYQGEGMFTRQALARLIKDGVCREALMPGIWHYPHQKKLLTPDVYKDALPQRINTYAAINTVEEAKNAIYVNGAIVIVIPVYDSFYTCTGELRVPDVTKEKLHGYHAMVVPGYTKDRYIVVNSHGKGWGKDGICYMPLNYPINEMWAITDLVMPHDTIKMKIGSNVMNVNGVSKTIDVAPFIKDGRTMLPIRHVAEALGAVVDWDEKTRTVVIIK